ncbi:uncharacterized protein N7479_005280 [Penicillium vulpinum]|uniref:Uncharacterized protein n=1 Tax=Penicillium vulpinum TaxID=29845 RepID=A0A1V6RI80_9EURO|nr:uncharacterized protein N7479_005280 [Penicillium vulpinum]KAJ5958130.1 hypothetical protein N7479_005280 [Penicillium vulpinum]OQE01250.1 hypothetical protein PENVUL_c043G01307 [Penicillium vulpinum]
MSSLSDQAAKKIELKNRELQLQKRKLELDLEKHQLQVECDKTELEKQRFRIKQDEYKLKERIDKLEEIETEFETNGPDIIRLTISKKVRRAMAGTKESQLKCDDDMNALQRFRYERYVYEQDLNEKDDRLADLLDTETRLRELAQREQCLMEQLEQDPARFQQEIIDGQKEYILTEREWWIIRNSFSNGALERGFEYWRSHPRWYLHRVLREDCAGRGGCCGRDCGCCVDRKLGSHRKLAVGHCTIECGCCQKARGFELSEDEKRYLSIRYAVSQDGTSKKNFELKDLQLKNLELQRIHSQELMKDRTIRYEFPEGGVVEYERYINQDDGIPEDEAEFTDNECPVEEDPYYHRICQASIWGLVEGNFDKPYDLIDTHDLIEEPRYKQACESTWGLGGSNKESFSLVSHEDNNSMMTETDW